MSGDIYQIETRRRSRSKTPFLRSEQEASNEESQVQTKKKKSSAAPNVQTIVEETISESSTLRQLRGKPTTTSSSTTKTTQVTSDYSSDENATAAESKQSQERRSTSSTVTTVLTRTSQRLGNVLGGLTSTPNRGGKGHLETTQNVLNTAQELRSGNGAAGGNLSSEHLAYLEYRDAGEYWNKTPKTDYTYSELSPHRRVLAPGIIAMPNMSRRSLDNHDARVNFMVQQNPAQEEFIRRRYQTRYTEQQQHLNYDSSDEVDITHLHQTKKSWWLWQIITTILTSISSAWTRITRGRQPDAYQTYYARQQQRGLFTRIIHGIKSSVWSSLSYIYLFIASVLSWDTVLLKSSNAENKSKKRFLLLLLILLPLLLLTGLYYYLHPGESFPPRSFSEYTFTLPELPRIDVKDYINPVQFEAIKEQAVEQAIRVRDWADDYVLYLKTIGQNVVAKGRGLFQTDNEVYYERV